MDAPRALVSWSGGKDSCLALHRARLSGLQPALLVTALDESGVRSRSHGVPPELHEAQAEALGVPVRFYSASWTTYEELFVEMLREAKAEGVTHAVFGDIDIPEHRAWEERVCGAAGLQAVLPLWGGDRRALVREFLGAGYRAVVVVVDGRYLTEEFVGREFDAEFVDSLPHGVDPAGENGEFHTFVYDGPAFARPVEWRRGKKEKYTAPEEYGGVVYYFQTIEPAEV
ncbi:hypothetical protein DFJ74DRAFT_771562 [Hyaloraphidium curvatum]|nr:hypothetical protein DFJ74DRAFT_771562 [Hyaloraphidium curvatum]